MSKKEAEEYLAEYPYEDYYGNGKVPLDEGMFGIHIHKAGEASTQVDRWSAGCQVLARKADFLRMMELYDASAALYGPRVTYTLLTERDFS